MTLEEKYEKAIETLRAIAKFGHTRYCNSSAPVHECCCNDIDERELAQKCLGEIDD